MLKPFKLMLMELTAWGRFWLGVGLAVLVAACLMSFDFGYQVSIKHAVFLGLLSVFTAFAPETAYRMWKTNRKGEAAFIMLAVLPFFAIEFYSHAGYTAGLRGTNVSAAQVQEARYTMAQADEADNRANLELWRNHLAQLEAEAPWAATVTAEALRSELETANKAIELETKRGGCGPICERKMKARDVVADRLGKAEAMQNYRKQIEATQRILDTKRKVAASTEYTPSAVDEQNRFLAKNAALLYTGSLEVSPVMQETVTQSVNLMMALAGTTLPAFALFMAGLYRVREIEEDLPPVGYAENVQPVAPAHVRPEKAPLPKVALTPAKPVEAINHGEQEREINISVPLTVNHTGSVDVQGTDAFAHARRIGKVRDTAFARRVEQITRGYRTA